MKKSTKQKLVKIEIILAVLILLICFLALFTYSSITGFVSVESKIQLLDMVIDKSQSFILTSNNDEPYTLTSFKISGEIMGDGVAEIYLIDATGKKILIHENVAKKPKTMSAITGMITTAVRRSTLYEAQELNDLFLITPDKELKETPQRTLAENEEIKTGLFSNSCKDSCFLELAMSKNNRYNIITKVEPGTIMKINQIVITFVT